MRRNDLEAAIEAGILDRATTDRLSQFLVTRGVMAADDPSEEIVDVTRNFNEVFLSLGVALLFVGIGFSGAIVAFPLVAWIVAEVFKAWRPVRLPLIVLAVMFTAGLGWDAGLLAGQDSVLPKTDWALLSSGGALIGALLFALRFRLPFAAALVTAAAGCLAYAVLRLVAPNATTTTIGLLALLIGLVAFAAGLWLDIGDRLRRTTAADTAFWFHLAAAPGIVHGMMTSTIDIGSMSTVAAAEAVGLIAVLMVIALAIDRRALLVSALAYLVASIGVLAQGAKIEVSSATAIALIVVGCFVLVIGIGWRRARQVVLSFIPAPLAASLPPLVDRGSK